MLEFLNEFSIFNLFTILLYNQYTHAFKYCLKSRDSCTLMDFTLILTQNDTQKILTIRQKDSKNTTEIIVFFKRTFLTISHLIYSILCFNSLIYYISH